MRTVKSIPKDELQWSTIINKRKEYVITSTYLREKYLLYERLQNGFQLLGKAKSPLELEEKFIKYEG